MADSYTQGTVSPFLHLDKVAIGVLDFDPDDFDPDYPDHSVEEFEVARVWHEIMGDDGQENRLQLSREHIQPTAKGDAVYYLYAEEGAGDAEAAFLQWLIKRQPEDVKFVTFEYASTCSKMRPGEFGGGAWFITRDNIEFFGSGSWLVAKEHELAELARSH